MSHRRADDHYVVVMPRQGGAGLNVPARLPWGWRRCIWSRATSNWVQVRGEPSLVLTSACLVQTYRRSASSDESHFSQGGGRLERLATRYVALPRGRSTVTHSPTLRPIKARARGDSTLMLPAAAFASSGPTRR